MSLPDTFTGTDETALSTYDATWVRKATWNGSSGGYVKILSNAAVFDTGSGPAVYYYNSAPSSADYETSVDITITSDIPIGVAMRISSSGENAYFAYIPGKAYNVRLYKVVSGSQSQIGTSSGTVTWTNGSTHNLKIKCTGTSIEAYWDGTLMLTVTDSSISAAGFPGLYIPTASGASYDNFTATGYSGTTITGNLGTATAAGIAASIAAAVTISCSLGGAVASGHQASISTGSNVTINASAGTATASGYAASVVSSGSATITTDVFKNNTGTVLASTSIPKAVAIKLSDLTVGASWTNQTTNGSGVLSLTGAMATGDYLLVVSNADGSAVGVKKYTAS